MAATAEQILEALNKDPGLMVEYKRVLAQDAGDSGQILEESDLGDAAINERLHQDLRTRVLATRLLRRFGYLLPRFNPGSDPAAEHDLTLRERAQTILSAAERSSNAQQERQTQQPSTCLSEKSKDCLPVDTLSEQETQPPRQGLQDDGRTPRSLQRAAVDGVLEDSRPDVLTLAPELQRGMPLPGRQEILPASTRQSNLGSGPASPERNTSEATANLSSSFPGSPTDLVPRRVSKPVFPQREAAAEELEPTRMERRPNPYAPVPSLFDLYVQTPSPDRKMERFGLDVFRRGAAHPDFLPMDLPVGPDYVVGPGDSLSINLWGGVSERLLRVVDREGRVALPEAGPVLVSGRSLGDVQQTVQRTLRTQFRDISADVSLLRLRTVRVYLVGDVAEPGAYDISSLSTALNALFTAGGVTPRGSLRHLEHYRGGKLIEEVDAYDLLLHGVRGELARMENGDSLRVPPLGPAVTVEGMVRRPAVYELMKESNLGEVLDLAGGILPAAALRHIEVQRLVAHEKRTMLSLEINEASDIKALHENLRKFAVQDADEIHIFPIAPYNESAIYLEGHVLRPGRYSYHEGMKLTDVISSYKDLLPEPSGRYAEIIRIEGPDYRPVVQAFDLAEALAHPEKAPELKPLDSVQVFGRFDFESAPEVMVTGEVRAPGRYRASGEEHLRDAIYLAGGLTPEAWFDAGQLFRGMPDGSTKVFSINLRNALEGDSLNNILLEPRDRLLVHRRPDKVEPPSVHIRGEVARAGRYPLTANMRISDLVRSAGGLLRSANPAGGDLTHYSASGTANPPQATEHQEINLSAALEGEVKEDPPLRDGDVLTVPEQARWKDMGALVTLRGEVARPGTYGIQPGERLSSLLRRAGGLLPTAYPQAAVFERTAVYEMQQKSRQELIQRLEQESTVVKTSASTTGSEEAALQQTALQQRERMLDALHRAPISGRLVIHLRSGGKAFESTSDDIELRAGDSLTVPKQPGAVIVVGQVYNANALTYRPGKNAEWYLSRSGGATQLANKGAIFIIRADGSVTSGRKSGLWSGSVLSATVGPGDTIVVPEKTVVGGNVWKNITAIAQIAQAGALAAAVAIP